MPGMSPGEQSFVQLEGEKLARCASEAFVRESGEKECGGGGLEEEKGARTGRRKKMIRKNGEREKREEEEGRTKSGRDHEISVNRKSGGGPSPSRFNAR